VRGNIHDVPHKNPNPNPNPNPKPKQELANVLDKRNDNSPLHIAAQNGHLALVQVRVGQAFPTPGLPVFPCKTDTFFIYLRCC
jgi:hypothetical protein